MMPESALTHDESDRVLIKALIAQLKTIHFPEFNESDIDESSTEKSALEAKDMRKAQINITLEPEEIKAMFRECLREQLATVYDLSIDDINERDIGFVQSETDGSIKVTIYLDPVVTP